ncbi:hypothetical protein [Pseudogulbenkiania subflava]|uniref:Uncharacterized protein n=1 Tax=Pseudogulbenkiania subflava DSM 22618 TaxID=1123014 RepID=A0A1Y6BK43_9NEIS|nr:hypothetical protein [Pseudogulbenkiania subflava]SMF15804.1 hypothetical protein SAMN02745746_01619 [Pseudogulbenkiania subflava DSM 22618]
MLQLFFRRLRQDRRLAILVLLLSTLLLALAGAGMQSSSANGLLPSLLWSALMVVGVVGQFTALVALMKKP